MRSNKLRSALAEKAKRRVATKAIEFVFEIIRFI